MQDQSALLSKQLLQEQGTTIKELSDKLTATIAQRYDAADSFLKSNTAAISIDLSQRLTSISNAFEIRLAEQQTNLDDYWNDTSDQASETISNLTDFVDMKFDYAMAYTFKNEGISQYNQKHYLEATGNLLFATYGFLVSENLLQCSSCVDLLKYGCFPKIKREEFATLRRWDAQYRLDLLIFGLSNLGDKPYYEMVSFLKAERKRLTGEDYSVSFQPRANDYHLMQKILPSTNHISF